jgi:hypothetical protein
MSRASKFPIARANMQAPAVAGPTDFVEPVHQSFDQILSSLDHTLSRLDDISSRADMPSVFFTAPSDSIHLICPCCVSQQQLAYLDDTIKRLRDVILKLHEVKNRGDKVSLGQ